MLLHKIPKLELTLAILKPHVVCVPHVIKDIQQRILDHGFYVIRTKMHNITQEQATLFYEEHIGKFFFNRLTTFMCSGPCYFHVLAREDAIKVWREALGPTKVFKTIFSHPESIRGTHGLTDTRNACHGSDSTESAAREIKVFFPDFSISEWYEREEASVRAKQCHLSQDAFVHVTRQSV